MKALNLEKSALAAFANHATVDLPSAAKLLDEHGCAPEDFADAHIRALWLAVTTAVRDGRPPDFFALERLLAGKVPRPVLVEVLVENTETSGARERVAAVRDAGARRRAIAALDAARALLADTSRPISDGIAEGQRAIEALAATAPTSASAAGDLLTLADHLEQVDLGRREPVLITGFPQLDEAIGGLQRTLTIVGSMPAVGKSGFVAGLCRNLAARGVKVGLFSLEDERGWLVRRLVSEASDVPLFVLANRKLHQAQKDRVGEAMQRLHPTLGNLVIDDTPGLGVAGVVASARAMIRDGVEAIVVDHLGEVRLSRSERYDLDLAEVLRDLRSLAKVYGVPVVVACHVKRRDGLDATKPPTLTDFANSSGIERMARVALALSRPDEKTLAVSVLKQTSGPAGVVIELPFHAQSATVIQS